jgi:hypothetical protein
MAHPTPSGGFITSTPGVGTSTTLGLGRVFNNLVTEVTSSFPSKCSAWEKECDNE